MKQSTRQPRLKGQQSDDCSTDNTAIEAFTYGQHARIQDLLSRISRVYKRLHDGISRWQGLLMPSLDWCRALATCFSLSSVSTSKSAFLASLQIICSVGVLLISRIQRVVLGRPHPFGISNAHVFTTVIQSLHRSGSEGLNHSRDYQLAQGSSLTRDLFRHNETHQCPHLWIQGGLRWDHGSICHIVS